MSDGHHVNNHIADGCGGDCNDSVGDGNDGGANGDNGNEGDRVGYGNDDG